MPILSAADLTNATSGIRNQRDLDRAGFKAAQLESIRTFAAEIRDNMEAQLAAHQQRVIANNEPYTVDSLCDRYRDPDFFPNEGFTPWFTSTDEISCIDGVVGRCTNVNSMDLARVSPELLEMLKPTIERAEALGFRSVFDLRSSCSNKVQVSVKLRAPATIRDLHGDGCLNNYDRQFLARP